MRLFLLIALLAPLVLSACSGKITPPRFHDDVCVEC